MTQVSGEAVSQSGGAAGASAAESPASEVCQTVHPPLPERQTYCKASQASSGASHPDLDSRPKEDTSDQRSLWQGVGSRECPLLTVKLGHPDASSQSLQCLVTASLLSGCHISTEDAEPVESSIKLTDEVHQSPVYLVSGMSGEENWVGGCDGDDVQTDECPVCNELYRSTAKHRAALLNCDHTLCEDCLSKMARRAADPSRVQCPLCRQRTPLLRWEIRRMQEETMSHGAVMAAADLTDPFLGSSSSPPSSSRFCTALEWHLRARAESEVVCGCFRRPRWLSRALGRSRRCHCCYMALLLALGTAELCLLLLVFLPVVTLVLLVTLVGR